VAKTFIKASEIQKGDLIKVTIADGDRKSTHEGVASYKNNHTSGEPRWETSEGLPLWTAYAGATIQLLNRPEPPKPVILLPTGDGALISYKHNHETWLGSLVGATWTFRPQKPNPRLVQSFKMTPAETKAMLEADHRTDYTVLFGGFAK
jgi:hypothetical protein